jgi:20S proteasome alpha/beta subunit
MTLALAIKAVDAVVMAADSRGTIGDPRGLTAINDTQQKLFQLGTCGLVMAGASEMALRSLSRKSRRYIRRANRFDRRTK